MYVCALLIISPGNLIDINPFCEMTYSLLFSREELRKWECFHKGECPFEKEGVSTEPEIRVIDSVGIRSAVIPVPESELMLNQTVHCILYIHILYIRTYILMCVYSTYVCTL